MAAGTVPTSEAEAGIEPSRRVRRHVATKARIIEAAWQIARAEGLSGIALRDLAGRVDLSQSSLYSYFDSKNALFDAMFADGYRQLLDEIEQLDFSDDPREALKQAAVFLVRVSADDVPRFQLLFTRTIPGFEPSPDSYALAVEFFESGKARAAAAGLTTDHDFDLYTAVVAGLSNQQLANDPGGDRWLLLVDEAIDMLLDRGTPNRSRSKRGR